MFFFCTSSSINSCFTGLHGFILRLQWSIFGKMPFLLTMIAFTLKVSILAIIVSTFVLLLQYSPVCRKCVFTVHRRKKGRRKFHGRKERRKFHACKTDIAVRGVSSFVDSSAGNRGWHVFRKIEERNTR